jgi:hypothetical protein
MIYRIFQPYHFLFSFVTPRKLKNTFSNGSYESACMFSKSMPPDFFTAKLTETVAVDYAIIPDDIQSLPMDWKSLF